MPSSLTSATRLSDIVRQRSKTVQPAWPAVVNHGNNKPEVITCVHEEIALPLSP